MKKNPIVTIESGNKATAIVGYSKKDIPNEGKKVLKRQMKKESKSKK